MRMQEWVNRSLETGLIALGDHSSGELLVGSGLQSRALEDSGSRRVGVVESPFGSAFVLSALSSRLAPRARDVAGPYVSQLLEAVEPSGLSRFSDSYHWPIPPDADDTACVLAALKAWGVPEVEYHHSLDSILANRDEAGRLQTWFLEQDDARGELQQEVHVVVVINVLYYAALLGWQLPEDERFVETTLSKRGFAAGGDNSYYPYPLVACYCLARWLALVDGLPELRAQVRAFCLECSREDDLGPLDSALLLTCLARSGALELGHVTAGREIASRFADEILESQRSSGLWPAIGFFGDPANGTYGSRQVTTAACLEALAELSTLHGDPEAGGGTGTRPVATGEED